jgi:hypothetical protein
MAKRHFELVITEQPNGRLQPASGRVTKVKEGDTVKFTTEAGAKEPKSITFKGRNPFLEPVAYDTAVMTVRQPFIREGAADRNSYAYSCSFMKNGKKLETEGGGLLEIESSDN